MAALVAAGALAACGNLTGEPASTVGGDTETTRADTATATPYRRTLPGLVVLTAGGVIKHNGHDYYCVRLQDTRGEPVNLVTPDKAWFKSLSANDVVAITHVTTANKDLRKGVRGFFNDGKVLYAAKGTPFFTGEQAWNAAALLVFFNNDDDTMGLAGLGPNALAEYKKLDTIAAGGADDPSSFTVQFGPRTVSREYKIVRAHPSDGTMWAAIFGKDDREVAKVTVNKDGEFVGGWLGAPK
jgi:hypothetical protein